MSNLIVSIMSRMIEIEELLDSSILISLDEMLTNRLTQTRRESRDFNQDILTNLLNAIPESLMSYIMENVDLSDILPEPLTTFILNSLDDTEFEDVKVTLTKDEFDSLKKVIYNEKMNRELCIICTENYKIKDEIVLLNCDHSFHKECIEHWLLNYNTTCPDCRSDQRK